MENPPTFDPETTWRADNEGHRPVYIDLRKVKGFKRFKVPLYFKKAQGIFYITSLSIIIIIIKIMETVNLAQTSSRWWWGYSPGWWVCNSTTPTGSWTGHQGLWNENKRDTSWSKPQPNSHTNDGNNSTNSFILPHCQSTPAVGLCHCSNWFWSATSRS